MAPVELSVRELERAEVLARVLVGALSDGEAARQLGLSVRQVRRLKGKLAREGAASLVHGNRGRRPVHRLPDELRARVVRLATTTHAGVSHQRLRDLLAEQEQIVIARSTLRQMLLTSSE